MIFMRQTDEEWTSSVVMIQIMVHNILLRVRALDRC